ncbi:hypothetical protein GIB67_027592 [Kingdonia uniflora]|uniref:Small auxin up regulated protein n=1 Tax=Kingdonia uniflora TaxID=39325 RepID=A0A7J7NLF4_9MAGN|nr:hypothetical protein GIB67_027592 [Kingdonia uniflora]
MSLKISSSSCDNCCQWILRSCLHEKHIIPKDVPKGHLVVYVGEEHTRFVIKVALLKHPFFKALLDQAQEEYEFNSNSKLCIPCDEKFFASILRCAKTRQD